MRSDKMTEREELEGRERKISGTPATLTTPATPAWSLAPLIRLHAEAAIREFGILQAAKRLGVGKTTLYRWVRAWKQEDAR
jgi:transcriptional regulator of acetoin/glycerol metabolism